MDCDESSKVSLAEHDDVFAAEQSSSEEADGPGSVCVADLRCVTKQIRPLGKKVASTFVFWDTCCCVGPRSFSFFDYDCHCYHCNCYYF